VSELDEVIGKLAAAAAKAYEGRNLIWLVASEYVITQVDHVTYPNRVLREAGLLTVKSDGAGELIDFANTPAWALVDHQFSHVFVKDHDAATISRAASLFRGKPGFAEVLIGGERDKYALAHERSGDGVLISTPNSWQAYYYWLEKPPAPRFPRPQSGQAMCSLARRPIPGRPITTGSTTPRPPSSPAPSISTTSRATTQSSCTLISRRRAFHSTRRS